MNTESVSTLKIHKLTQAQYNRELEAGNIDTTALYLTPDEKINIEVSGAKVGQFLKVAGVDENGMPTKWEAVDAPAKGVDYWTEVDKAEIVAEVIQSVIIQYPEAHAIYGDIDDNNIITLHGDLSKGKYTLNFEDDAGNILGSVTMELGGPAYTNRADPTSSDWVVDKRMNSSAELVDATGCHTTNYFSCKKGDIIYVKGLDIRYTNSEHTQNARAVFFNTNGGACVGTYPLTEPKVVFDGVDMFTVTLDGLTNISGGSEEDVVKGRLSGMLFDGYTADDIIITVNEEITD